MDFNDRRQADKPPKYWGVFHGGYSYAHGGPSDAEPLQSLAHGRRLLQDRYDFKDRRFPGVDEAAEMHVYSRHPAEMADPYPDRIISMRPNGKTKMEMA